MTGSVQWLREHVARLAGVPAADIRTDRPLQQYGLSSRDIVSLAVELGRLLGRSVSPALVCHHAAIDDLVLALQSLDMAAEPGA